MQIPRSSLGVSPFAPHIFAHHISPPAQLVTVGSEAAVTIYLCPIGQGDDREGVSATASVKGGRRVRLKDMSNASELLKTP